MHACVHLEDLTKRKLHSWVWGGLSCPRSPALAPDTLRVQRPLPPSCPRVLTRVPPFMDLSVHTSGAYVDRQIDGQMDG